jgi:plasmid stabilization system protein ParE
MDKYKIKLNPRAYRDLEEIFAYIALKNYLRKMQRDKLIEF